MLTLTRFTCLTLGVVSLTAGTARAQTADEIIEKHIAALGGRPALTKLVSRQSTGTATLSARARNSPVHMSPGPRPPVRRASS